MPFGEEEEDPFEIYRLILGGNYDYPAYFLTPENQNAKDFIDILLNMIPEARHNGSYAALKAHHWFEEFDWNALEEKTLDAPYRPPSNCFMTDEEIQELVSDNADIPNYIKNKYEDEPIRQTF